jgi:glutathione S-transferase
MRAPLAMQLGLIEDTVRNQAFLVGRILTLADCFLFPLLHLASFTPEGVEALVAAPAANHWLARMRARPSFLATNPFAPAGDPA